MGLLSPVNGLNLEPDTSPYTGTTLTTNAGLINSTRFETVEIGYWLQHEAFGVELSAGDAAANITKLEVYGICGVTPSGYYGASYDSFEILKSSDNITWTSVETFDAPPIHLMASGQWGIRFTLTTPQAAKYWKVVMTDTSLAFNPGGASAQIGEVEIYGPATYEDTVTPGVGLSEAVSVDQPVVNETIEPGVGLSESVDVFDYTPVIAPGVGLSGGIVPLLEAENPVAPGVGLGAVVAASVEFNTVITPGVGFSGAQSNFNWKQWLDTYRGRYISKYYFTLTGAADGVADVEIPISSFSYRTRDGDPSYLQVVVPGIAYSAQIAARSNGDLRVEMAYFIDGIQHHREILAEVDLESIRVDEGAFSRSISLTGHRTGSFSAKIVTLYGVSYRAEYGGKRRVRCAEPDMYLRPGDTVNDNAESWVVGQVSTAAGRGVKWMEVVEAA